MNTRQMNTGRMKPVRILALFFALCAATILLVMGVVYAAGEQVPRSIMSGGGGSVSAGGLSMHSVVGQPVAGQVTGNGTFLRAGYDLRSGASVPLTTTTPTATATATTLTPTATATATPSGSGANTDVALNEVYYRGNANQDFIEIRNTGNAAINIGDWWLCSRFQYQRLSNMALLQGDDYILGPGETLTVRAWIDLNNNIADLGLYSSADFNLSSAMVDYVQWGTDSNPGRANVAFAKGIWRQPLPGQYEFVPTAADGQSASWSGVNSGAAEGKPLLTFSADWRNGTPTQGVVQVLTANFATGSPGSFFTFSADGFPPNATATIMVNGVLVTTANTDGSGKLSFTLNTQNLTPGTYTVVMSVNPQAVATFMLDTGAPLRVDSGTAPVVTVPAEAAVLQKLYLPSLHKQ